MSATLFEKLWNTHVISDLGGGWALLHVDLHLMHDLSGADAFRTLKTRRLRVHSPNLTVAIPDHAVSSSPGRDSETSHVGAPLYRSLREGASSHGIPLLDLRSGQQGIVHVVGPEQGWVLPGMSMACGDSHTCTNGALGALAIGIGSSEAAHVLATQTVRLHRPRNMRLHLTGKPLSGVTAKDLALHVIGTLGTAAGTGFAIEFYGSAISNMSMEGRLTICNMAVELGARYAVIAPDECTFEYVRGRRMAPSGNVWDRAVENWAGLKSDESAFFDKEAIIDASKVAPMITWGTSPDHVIAVDGQMPPLGAFTNPTQRDMAMAAYTYMGLEPGRALLGTPVDWIFIGSCANARISDLRDAARIARGRRVASHVQAWVVPGSEDVQRQAEEEGLDRVFREAGFQWRDPGCSMCAAVNGERVPPLARCVSTSNRNFVGRQGPQARTHLASPATAAASAILGTVGDVRSLSR